MAVVINDRTRAVVINDGTRPKIKEVFRFRRDGKIIIVEVKIKNPRPVIFPIPFFEPFTPFMP